MLISRRVFLGFITLGGMISALGRKLRLSPTERKAKFWETVEGETIKDRRSKGGNYDDSL